MRRVVTVRQIWREEVGRKKEAGVMPRKRTQACLQTASLLEGIQPISLGMGNDHALLKGSSLTTFA
jgi:hypothetical protein